METKDVVYSVAAVILVCIEVWKARKKKQQTVEDTVALNDQIYPVLWRLLPEYMASRVQIIQFHNGQFFYTGQSVQRNTMTHEVCHPGVHGMKSQLDNRATSNIIHEVIKRFEGGVWGFDDLALTDIGMCTPELQMECKIHAVRSAQYFRITDKKSSTVGILVIQWNFRQPMDVMAIESIKTKIRLIENIFANAR